MQKLKVTYFSNKIRNNPITNFVSEHLAKQKFNNKKKKNYLIIFND